MEPQSGPRSIPWRGRQGWEAPDRSRTKSGHSRGELCDPERVSWPLWASASQGADAEKCLAHDRCLRDGSCHHLLSCLGKPTVSEPVAVSQLQTQRLLAKILLAGFSLSRSLKAKKLLGESVAFHCWLFARRLEAQTQPRRLFGDHLWTEGCTQAVCRKPSCALLIRRAARWRMEFQLFLFRTRVCGRRQKSSLAEPQRQLAWPSAYICRKGRLVLTTQVPCSQPVPLTEPSARRAAALLWKVPAGVIRCKTLLRSISDPVIILDVLAGQHGNSQRRANSLLWADPQSHWSVSQLWPSVKIKDRTTGLEEGMEGEAAVCLGLHGGGWGAGMGAGREPCGWRRAKQETGGARVLLPPPLCDAEDPARRLWAAAT